MFEGDSYFNCIISTFSTDLRPVQQAGGHLRGLVAVVIDGEFAEHHHVGLLLGGELGQDLGDVERLEGVHLVCRHLHVDPAVSTHGQGCPDSLLRDAIIFNYTVVLILCLLQDQFFFRGTKAKEWSIIIKIGWPNITRHQVEVKLQNIIKLIVEAGNWIWDVSQNFFKIAAQTSL